LVGYLVSTVALEVQPGVGISPEISTPIDIIPEITEIRQCGWDAKCSALKNYLDQIRSTETGTKL
jgi:hypothetical protein